MVTPEVVREKSGRASYRPHVGVAASNWDQICATADRGSLNPSYWRPPPSADAAAGWGATTTAWRVAFCASRPTGPCFCCSSCHFGCTTESLRRKRGNRAYEIACGGGGLSRSLCLNWRLS